MRILMGTYSLSAGYYDAYYKRAQQVLLLLFYVFLDRSDLSLDNYEFSFIWLVQIHVASRSSKFLVLISQSSLDLGF